MKKKIFGLIITFALTLSAGAVFAYGADASIYPLTDSYSFSSESDIGAEFDVEFYVENNSQFDSATFYVLYDPDVVMFKEAVDFDLNDAVSYPISDVTTRYFISPSAINTAAARSADSSLVRFKTANSSKTCAEVGEIKLANYTSNLHQITDGGIIFGATFEVVGTGSTDIEIVGISAILASTEIGGLDVDLTPCSVSVSGSSSVETTTESPAETTTNSSSSSNSGSTSGGGSGGGSGSGSSGSATSESTTEAVTDESGEAVSEAPAEATTEKAVEYAFSDIDSVPWAVKAINTLASLKIVNGYTDGTFLPQNNVTRADFIIMLLNALGIEGTAESNFSDVRADKYYANYVGLAKDLGIATGYSDGTFAPEAFISRQDMMVLTWRAYLSVSPGDVIVPDESILDDFADKDEISAYAREAISAMVSCGIVSGTNVGIEPKANTTRAQTAVIMYNLLGLLEQ